jgi:tRNA (guanine37-N1)-methyltransferase
MQHTVRNHSLLTFSVITLFPELITLYCSTSIIGRGIKAGRIRVDTRNPRDHCTDKYRKVDDTPYGGGAGMVLKPEPFFAAFESLPDLENAPVLLMSPQGERFSQKIATELAQTSHIVFICGHYEGFDERIRSLCTREISIGDFILTGGELAALAIIDGVARLVPGVLGKSASLSEESLSNQLLEAPHYTKPVEFRGMVVPEILRSGDHKAVAKWRREQSLRRTFERRPDLLEDLTILSAEDNRLLHSLQKTNEKLR